MTYLYGDSTPSSIDIDYVDFAQRMLDLCAELVTREEAMLRIEAERDDAERANEASAARLRDVATLVRDALAPVSEDDDGDSTAARCATAIERAATDQVREELDRERSHLQATLQKLEDRAQLERDACVSALEALLLHWDLPDTTWEVGVVLEGETYTAVLSGTTPYGASTIVELCTHTSDTFDKIQRVGHLAPGLDLHAPQSGGWLRKSVKVAPQHIAKHCVTALTCSAGHIRLELRAQPDGEGGGYDVDVDRKNAVVRVFQVGKDSDRREFDPITKDVEPLVSFAEQLANAASALRADRRAVLEASFAGAPLAECPRPTELVRRFVAAMAPVITEMAAHSLSPGELVLRKPIADGRREEIFVSKRALGDKLASLPTERHDLFDALELDIQPPPARAESEVSEIDPDMIVETDSDHGQDPDRPQPPPPPPKPLTFLGQRSSTRPPTHQG